MYYSASNKPCTCCNYHSSVKKIHLPSHTTTLSFSLPRRPLLSWPIHNSLPRTTRILISGRAGGRGVKVLDSQPRNRGFESRHTLGLLCLSPLARFVPQMCLEVIVDMQLLACRKPHKINPSF